MKNKKIMLVLTSVVFFVSCSKQGEKNLKSETSTPSSMSESIDLGKVSSAMTSAENGRANWTSDYDGDCYWIQGQNMDGGDVISSQNHFELNYYYKTDFLSAKFKIPKGAFFQQKETREDLIYDFQVDFSEKKVVKKSQTNRQGQAKQVFSMSDEDILKIAAIYRRLARNLGEMNH